MKVVAAYLLALLGGNPSPTEKDIGTILSSVGAEAEDDRIALFFKSFQGRDISEVLALGQERFASLGGGGGGVVVSAGGGGGGGAASAAAAEAPKEEEKKEEPKEESDDDMGFSLFD